MDALEPPTPEDGAKPPDEAGSADPSTEDAARAETGHEAAGGGAEPSLSQVPWFEHTVDLLKPGANPPPIPRAALEERPDAPPPGRRPWLVDEGELAHGGMSHIHRILDRNLRRRAALKVLEARAAAQRASQLRFVEEAQITAQLDHPNIPPIHDLWVDEHGNICFTMKLVRGQTLHEILRARSAAGRGDEELERLLRIFLKVCDAVSFAHSRGVIHRDLKPENVMVGTHGQVYVMDWGCALIRDPGRASDEAVSVVRDPASETLDPPGCAIGTISYMAPEQACAETERIDERTDIHLLGGILYEILTDRAPHRGGSLEESLAKAQRGEVEDPQAAAGDVPLPPELCRIALRALAAEPAARYASVEELKDDVERSLRHGWWFTSATFRVGTLVVREGDQADAAYIITRGRCVAFRTEHGRQMFLREMGPGDTFGETAILTARPRTASVEVVEELTATVVTRESLERAVGGDSWVASFVRALAERFHELDARLSQLRQDAE